MKKKVLLALILTSLLLSGSDKKVKSDVIDFQENFSGSSEIEIASSFNSIQRIVDTNLFKEMAKVDKTFLEDNYKGINTPMFNKAKECINPLMAFATCWGEAGHSYGGVSLTQVMDFQPSTYNSVIDWISVSANLEQVGESWYLSNASDYINENQNGKAYGMPVNLLQAPIKGSRYNSEMTGLGVGPFQITTSDWSKYPLNDRVSPIEGWKWSLTKIGNAWTKCGIDPISDLTVYAALSLSHQGGGLITYPEMKALIQKINTPEVQKGFYKVAGKMYEDLLIKEETEDCSLNDIGRESYMEMLQKETGVAYRNYHVPLGRTNKGWYVFYHCLNYCFYKYYFTGGLRQ